MCHVTLYNIKYVVLCYVIKHKICYKMCHVMLYNIKYVMLCYKK